MTDNQFTQLFDLVTKCVSGIQRIETDVAVLKTDVAVLKTDVAELKVDVAVLKTDVAGLKTDTSELKEGQKRLEKEMRLNTAAVNQIAGEQVRMNNRVLELEKV
ncbi:MAG: hypothetical protein ACR2GD_07055 [Pyrinomonadaceae bacterium]